MRLALSATSVAQMELNMAFPLFAFILCTLRLWHATLSLLQAAKRVCYAEDPAAYTVTHHRIRSTCDPNLAPCAFRSANPVPLIMTSPEPWSVFAMLTSRMLYPRTV